MVTLLRLFQCLFATAEHLRNLNRGMRDGFSHACPFSAEISRLTLHY